MMQDKRINISLISERSLETIYKMMIPYVKDQEKFKDIQYYLFDEDHSPNWNDIQNDSLTL